MGVLKRAGDGAQLVLFAVTRVGRDPGNELALSDSIVSQFHAILRWAPGGHWEIRDLGSRNGTFVDGARLAPGKHHALPHMASVAFGEGTTAWNLDDAERPVPEAVDLASAGRILGTAQLLSLHGDGAVADVLEEANGNWQIDHDGKVSEIRSGDVVTVGGKRYRVSLPLPPPETEEVRGTPTAPPGLSSEEAQLTFFVSADLETVGLNVRWASSVWESNKAYNRALLALAEARQRDKQATQLPHHEQGWRYGDELCTLADYDGVSRLNVEVHRVRNDFARHNIPGGPSIIQRRRGTGQLRLGTGQITIVEGFRRP